MSTSHPHNNTFSSSAYQSFPGSSSFSGPISTSAVNLLSPLTNVHFLPYSSASRPSLVNLPDDRSSATLPLLRIPNNPYAAYPTHPPSGLLPPPLPGSNPYNTRNVAAHRHIAEPSHSPYVSAFANPSHPLSASPSTSLAERILRSPQPPLTGSIHPSLPLWPPQLYSIEQRDPLGRPFYSSPLVDAPAVVGPDSYHTSRPSSPYGQPARGPLHPSAPPFLPPPPTRFRTSPVLIPAPLRFKYSASPPIYDMPARKKPQVAAGSSGQATPLTPQTMSSSGSRRKPVGKGNGWTMEHTYDSIGQKKEVIVINDSESPGRLTRKRTRAQYAAEAALANGHSINGSSSSLAAIAKKRKADDASDAGSTKKAKGKASGVSFRPGILSLTIRLPHPYTLHKQHSSLKYRPRPPTQLK